VNLVNIGTKIGIKDEKPNVGIIDTLRANRMKYKPQQTTYDNQTCFVQYKLTDCTV